MKRAGDTLLTFAVVGLPMWGLAHIGFLWGVAFGLAGSALAVTMVRGVLWQEVTNDDLREAWRAENIPTAAPEPEVEPEPEPEMDPEAIVVVGP